MGYALFTARKLMLQTRLNNYNYRLMSVSEQRNQMVEQETNLQMKSSFNSSTNSIFLADQQEKMYNDILTKSQSGELDSGAVDQAQQKLENYINKMQAQSQLQSSADASQLKAIQMVENQLDLQQKKLTTQIQATTAEMEKVEQAEEKAIEKSAPKYGGG
ncbi:MAG: hypothetical protein PHV37_02755 [Candidatus Gastranaerophilales bacterium]|nr:hypothetical protein [Candidatus Gastranaerophilales bacterium]